MSQNEIKRWCRQDYGLHGNQRLTKINMIRQEFTIWLGSCSCDIPFSNRLKRQILLEKLLD